MSSIIYHVGLTPPPKSDYGKFKICHHPVLKVEYESINAPEDIRDILHVNPVILIMSKNAVIGLEKWLHRYDINDTFFQGATFWTVGEKTHSFLKILITISQFRHFFEKNTYNINELMTKYRGRIINNLSLKKS